MTSVLDIKSEKLYDLWTELYNNFFPIDFYFTSRALNFIIDDVNINNLLNAVFWIFLTLFIGYYYFTKLFQIFLSSSKIRYYKRKQFSRAVWNIAFHAASVTFLYIYHKYMISPALVNNTGRLFPTYENIIFYKCQPCERFLLYTLVIITYFLHSALLDFRESDFCEAASKILYSFALIALISHRFENYFVVLSINLGIFSLLTECLLLFALQTSSKKIIIYQFFLGVRILSWSHIFINILPFKYLVPTLFAKNFKIFLNIFIWLWYGMSIWNSPILQYFYHQIYHNTPTDCVGEGSAAKCILLKDSVDLRHFKTLRKAYLEVKLACSKSGAQSVPVNESASAKAFQAIKCVMTLKRKLRRIREGRESPSDEEGVSSASSSE